MGAGDQFDVGDRVTRIRYLGERESLRHGVITEIYEALGSLSATSTKPATLYRVRWDETGEVESGYMARGLEREAISLGGLGR